MANVGRKIPKKQKQKTNKKTNKMYKKIKPGKTRITHNNSYEGETIEQKINRIVNNKEPIKDGAPIIYTERKDGVKPEYDIRTDRFEIAVEAMSAVDKSHKAKREQIIGEKTYDTMTGDQQKAFNEKFPNNKHNKKTPPSGGEGEA